MTFEELSAEIECLRTELIAIASLDESIDTLRCAPSGSHSRALVLLTEEKRKRIALIQQRPSWMFVSGCWESLTYFFTSFTAALQKVCDSEPSLRSEAEEGRHVDV